MILELYMLFSVVFIPLFWVWQPLDSRSYLFILGTNLAVIVLIWVSFLKQIPIDLYIPSIPIALFLVWIFLSNSWSTAPKQSWIDTLIWLSMFVLFSVAQRIPKEFVLLAVSLPSYGMLPVLFYQKFKEKKHLPGSIFGNANHIGSYFTLSLFVFLWLSLNVSIWHLIMVGLLLIAIVLSKCKAAWISIISTLVILLYFQTKVNFILVLPILLCALYFVKLKPHVRNKYFAARLGYYVAVLDCIIRRPLSGWGLRTFRREQFFAVHRIQKRRPNTYRKETASKAEHVYEKFPLPRTHRVHNDYLEICHETGLVGLFLFLYILYQLQWTQDLILSAGLLAILIMALFFFPLREPHIAAPFWALAGTISQPGVVLPPGYSLFVVILVLAISYMAYQYAYKKLVAIYWWMKVPGAETEEKWKKALSKCYKNDPYQNQFLMYFYRTHLKVNPSFALDCMSRMSEHYDGSITVASIQSIRPKFAPPEMVQPQQTKKQKKRGKR
jgi:O-antigen ligase